MVFLINHTHRVFLGTDRKKIIERLRYEVHPSSFTLLFSYVLHPFFAPVLFFNPSCLLSSPCLESTPYNFASESPPYSICDSDWLCNVIPLLEQVLALLTAKEDDVATTLLMLPFACQDFEVRTVQDPYNTC
jgi:hypothetical protein